MNKESINIYKMNDAKENRLWEKSIFIFDSSVLLDLYFLPNNTRSKIYTEVFEKISNRLWIPSHVEYEYLKNREKIIKKPIVESYKPLEEDIKNIQKELNKNVSKRIDEIINKTRKDDKHPHINQDEITLFKEITLKFSEETKKFEEKVLEQIKNAKQEILDIENNDDVLDAIEKYFSVGKSFTFNEIIDITKEGKHRFEFEIPPGYGDLVKGEKKGTQIFADLIIWKQILIYAKEKELPIIFITNDVTKDNDWCYIDKDKRIISPREELIKEINDFANIEFWMYNQSQFLYYANKYLKSNITDKTIQNISEHLNYKDLISKISNIIFKYDPIEINFGHNNDEYDPEAESIVSKLKTVTSKEETINMVYEVFLHFFSDSVEIIGEKNSKLYLDMTTEIWNIWINSNSQVPNKTQEEEQV